MQRAVLSFARTTQPKFRCMSLMEGMISMQDDGAGDSMNGGLRSEDTAPSSNYKEMAEITANPDEDGGGEGGGADGSAGGGGAVVAKATEEEHDAPPPATARRTVILMCCNVIGGG